MLDVKKALREESVGCGGSMQQEVVTLGEAGGGSNKYQVTIRLQKVYSLAS